MYRQIFKNSLINTWRLKGLWFFGLFASLLAYKDGFRLWWQARGELFFPLTRHSLWQEIINSGILDFLRISTLFDFLVASPGRFFVFLIVFVVIITLLLFIIWLAVISQGALIYTHKNLADGQSLTFWVALERGKKKFWGVLFFNASFKILVYLGLVLFLGVFSVRFLAGHFVLKQIVALMVVLGLAGVAILISFIVRLGLIHFVNGRFSLIESLAKGWRIFWCNRLASLEMIILMAGVRIIFWLLLIITLFFILTPFVLMVAGSFIVHSFFLFRFGLYLGITLGVFAILCAVVFYTVFQWSAWTMFFGELQEGNLKSKLVRIISRLVR